MVYTHALRACGASHAGSSPASGTGQWSMVNGQWSMVNGQWSINYISCLMCFSLYSIPQKLNDVVVVCVKNVHIH